MGDKIKLVRFPAEIYSQIEKLAKDERRSISAQIIKMLEDQLTKKEKTHES